MVQKDGFAVTRKYKDKEHNIPFEDEMINKRPGVTMTLKHVLTTTLCLVFWTAYASAAGYYLDIEETDDSQNPDIPLTLVCTGPYGEPLKFKIKRNSFSVEGVYTIAVETTDNNIPKRVHIYTGNGHQIITLSGLTPEEAYAELKDQFPLVNALADPEWFAGLSLYIVRNTHTMDPCEVNLFLPVANFLQMLATEDETLLHFTFMTFVNRLVNLDTTCYSTNDDPWEPNEPRDPQGPTDGGIFRPY